MGFCFICNAKLFDERTRVCSSLTVHNSIPFADKIAELMGDKYVIVVTPGDHVCNKCSSLISKMDKLESDIKAIRNSMVSQIQKKYGLLSPNVPIKELSIVNEQLVTDLEVVQKRVPSGLNLKKESIQSPLVKVLKPRRDDDLQMKMYKCKFCTFQSMELGHVRTHMRNHVLKDNEKANQTATINNPAPQQQQPLKKLIYRCQVCSASFDNRMVCLEHIHNDHNQQNSANEVYNKEDVSSGSITEVSKPLETLKPNCNQQAMDIEQKTEGTVITAKNLLNGNDSTEETVTEKQDDPKEDKNGDMYAKEAIEQLDQEFANRIVQAVEGNMAIGDNENQTDYLALESMLAAIHNESSS